MTDTFYERLTVQNIGTLHLECFPLRALKIYQGSEKLQQNRNKRFLRRKNK